VTLALTLAAVLIAYTIAWLHAIEPVMVYGPSGTARLVPRYVAERLAAQGKLEEATTPAAAREAMGLPSVHIDSDPSGFAGIDRSVHDGPSWRDQVTDPQRTIDDALAFADLDPYARSERDTFDLTTEE
jgi:hypothetical protein